jgi:uncharacterized repeat protein (TIGR01451 family)
VGDTVVFIIDVGNTGNMNAANVKITDIVPAKLEIIEGSLESVKPQLQYDRQNKKITWNS